LAKKPKKKPTKKKLAPMLLPIFLIFLTFIVIFVAEYIYETPWESALGNDFEGRLGEAEGGTTEGDPNNDPANNPSAEGGVAGSSDPADNRDLEDTTDQDSNDSKDTSDKDSGEEDRNSSGSDSDRDERSSKDSDSSSDQDGSNSSDSAPTEKSISVAENLGVSETSYTRYLTADLNIRGDADKNAKQLGVFNKGTQVHVIGELSNGWVKVEYGSADAFIHSAYLSTTDPTARPPTREDSSTVVNSPGATEVLVNKDYRLPSSYIPPNLVEPNVQMAPNAPSRLLRSVAAEALQVMFNQASEEGIELYAQSGYRSYNTQKNLYSSYVRNHGYERASRFSAQPGHSEHQTGLAMDVTSESAGYKLTQSFGTTPEGQWVAANAHRFGFIIRYPQNKESVTGYMYEPWHLRYLGVDLATAVHASSLTYEEYLGY